MDIDSDIEVPRGADNTVLDYTELGLDIEFPSRLGISVVGEDLIDLSELDIRTIDEGNITSDEVQNEIFRLFDSFLIDNKNIMELIANKLRIELLNISKRKQENLWEPKLLKKINK